MKTSIVPFGKYKGQPIEVMQADRQYTDWLTQQDWFKSRYSQINNIIINNFGAPSETPEHNELVANFTDRMFSIAFILSMYNISDEGIDDVDIDKSEVDVVFESPKGSDVIVYYNIIRISGESGLKSNSYNYPPINIECKPHISDDFPAIIRQCRSQETNCVLYKSMMSEAVSAEQIKIMFGGIKLVTIDTVNRYKRLLESR